jgi:ribose 1,5-bisphosphokinase PhnN
MDVLEQRMEERQREADLSTVEQETSRVNESPGLRHQDKSPLQPLENQPPRKLHEDHEDQPQSRQLHKDIHDLFGDQWPLQLGQMDVLEQRMEERQREADLRGPAE